MDGSEKRQETMYAAEEQVEIWKEDADRLNLSKSEFYREMIQAGRREFGLSDDYNEETTEATEVPVDDLEARIRDAITAIDGPASFEDIVNHVVDEGLGKQIDDYLRNAPDLEYSSYEGGYIFKNN